MTAPELGTGVDRATRLLTARLAADRYHDGSTPSGEVGSTLAEDSDRKGSA